ncbi:MAG: DnaJ domain-containing protein [Halobacteriaceae archaeon]
MPDDFYDLLGVDEDASGEEVKRAFREKVREYHPDVNDDERANAQFETLHKAYDVLSDPEERKAYDRLGHGSYVAKRMSGGLPNPEQFGASGRRVTRSGDADGSSAGGSGGSGSTSRTQSRSRSRSRSQSGSRSRSRSRSGRSDESDDAGETARSSGSTTRQRGARRSRTTTERASRTRAGKSASEHLREVRRRELVRQGLASVAVAAYLVGLLQLLGRAPAAATAGDALAAGDVGVLRDLLLAGAGGLTASAVAAVRAAAASPSLILALPVGAAALPAAVFGGARYRSHRGSRLLAAVALGPLVGFGLGAVAVSVPTGVGFALYLACPLLAAAGWLGLVLLR